MRMVVDLADLDGSSWVNQTGQSGHVSAEHYADQTPAWAAQTSFPWPFSPAAVNAAAVDRLDLQPAAG